MTYSHILKTGLICLCIAACDTQQPTTPIKIITEAKATLQTNTPPLNLSIDHIAIEPQANDDTSFLINKAPDGNISSLFNKLNKTQPEPNINLSAKLLTDEEKLDNREYLDSIEGVQININGKFK